MIPHNLFTATALVRLATALLAAIALLAVACGDDEAQVPDDSLPSETASRSVSPGDATPSPAVTTPAITIQACKNSDVDARTLAPTAGNATRQYTDTEGAYSLAYPAEWEVCQVHPDPEIRDLANWINFIAKDELPHASILVYANPGSLSLEKWIKENNPIFLDSERMAKERIVAGQPALFTAIDAEGLPRGEAYISDEDRIIYITTLRLEEFDRFANGITFSHE